MTKEERLERSRIRAAEHKRRRRMQLTIVIVGLGIYVLVPLLWYGAVEFGLVHPIRTPEFNSALEMAGLVAVIAALYFLPDLMNPIKDEPEKKDDPETDANVQLPPAA